MASLNALAKKRAFIVGEGVFDELPDLRKAIGNVEGCHQLFAEKLSLKLA